MSASHPAGTIYPGTESSYRRPFYRDTPSLRAATLAPAPGYMPALAGTRTSHPPYHPGYSSSTVQVESTPSPWTVSAMAVRLDPAPSPWAISAMAVHLDPAPSPWAISAISVHLEPAPSLNINPAIVSTANLGAEERYIEEAPPTYSDAIAGTGPISPNFQVAPVLSSPFA